MLGACWSLHTIDAIAIILPIWDSFAWPACAWEGIENI